MNTQIVYLVTIYVNVQVTIPVFSTMFLSPFNIHNLREALTRENEARQSADKLLALEFLRRSSENLNLMMPSDETQAVSYDLGVGKIKIQASRAYV